MIIGAINFFLTKLGFIDDDVVNNDFAANEEESEGFGL